MQRVLGGQYGVGASKFLANHQLPSCSGACPGRCSKAALRLPPCRVTNTSDEIYKALKIRPDEEEGIVEYPDYQPLNPAEGKVELRVKRLFLDALLEEDVDLDETQYWFSSPSEGWKQDLAQVEVNDEVEVTWAEPYHGQPERSGRRSLDDLVEGQQVEGLITDVWLYHGVQIDIGAEYDGLIPVEEDQWIHSDIRQYFNPGTKVTVKIHKVRQPAGMYRWPVQLAVPEAAVQQKLIDPDLYEPSINHGWAFEQGMSFEDVKTATGRSYEPMRYFAPKDDAPEAEEVRRAFGHDDDDMDVPQVNDLEEEWLVERSSEVQSVAGALMF